MFSKDPAKAQRSRISGIMGGSYTDCGSTTLLTHEPLITSQLPSPRIEQITGFLKQN
jgi:hypothetical protein